MSAEQMCQKYSYENELEIRDKYIIFSLIIRTLPFFPQMHGHLNYKALS